MHIEISIWWCLYVGVCVCVYSYVFVHCISCRCQSSIIHFIRLNNNIGRTHNKLTTTNCNIDFTDGIFIKAHKHSICLGVLLLLFCFSHLYLLSVTFCMLCGMSVCGGFRIFDINGRDFSNRQNEMITFQKKFFTLWTTVRIEEFRSCSESLSGNTFVDN